uniref:Uncharacterized protein n=1 Tax=Solanum lycopersicum TaxID=4081 RepID=A0A3Q7ILE6_SOLLC
MSKPNTLRRFTRGTNYTGYFMVEIPSFDLWITQIQSKISGYTAAMELEKKSNDELVRSSPSKRKVVSTGKTIGKKYYKRRKVKNSVSDMIGEPIVNEEQDEVSEESHSSSISSSSSSSWCVKPRDDLDLLQNPAVEIL